MTAAKSFLLLVMHRDPLVLIRNLGHPLGKPSLVVRTARTRPYALVRGDSRAAPSVRKHKRPLDRFSWPATA